MNIESQIVIIFSGPDMCGKTNISKELSMTLGIPYFKSSEERAAFLTNQNKFILDTRHADTRMADFLMQTGHSVIFDRAYPCEWVYGKFFGREVDEIALRYVDDIYSKLNVPIIITHRSSYDTIKDDLDPSLTGKRLAKIEDLYREFSLWTNCACYFLNVDSADLSSQIYEIQKFLNIHYCKIK